MPRLADQHGNFLVGGHPPFLEKKGTDGVIALFTALAEFLKRLGGDACNLKAALAALVEAVHCLIAQFAHRTRQGVAVDLGKVSPLFVNVGGL